MRDLGADAVHTTFYEDGHLLDDNIIRRIATEEERIVVTKDADFRDFFLVKGSPPQVLLITTGNISNKDLMRLLEDNYHIIAQLFDDGNNMIVLNRNSVAAYLASDF